VKTSRPSYSEQSSISNSGAFEVKRAKAYVSKPVSLVPPRPADAPESRVACAPPARGRGPGARNPNRKGVTRANSTTP
jgi:hypothetical protein